MVIYVEINHSHGHDKLLTQFCSSDFVILHTVSQNQLSLYHA